MRLNFVNVDGEEFDVSDRKYGDVVGKIFFSEKQKRWVFEPSRWSVFDVECLKEVLAFLESKGVKL